jgi:hypothetical protein
MTRRVLSLVFGLASRGGSATSAIDDTGGHPRGCGLSRRLLWASCWIGTVLAPSAWAQIPLGPEFQVNSYTTNQQLYSAIASDSAGNFVVVWTSYGQDGSFGGIFARKYLASGAPLGSSEFRVNAYTTGGQRYPSVASDPSGHLVIAWASYGQDGQGTGIVGRRLDPAGVASPEFQANTYTSIDQDRPTVAMDAAGNFVVAWDSRLQDGDYGGIFAQRYNAAGAPQGSEFEVNSYTTYFQYHPSAAMDAAGNFVVVWDSFSQDGSLYGVFGQRYSAAGAPQGAEFRVNTYTTGDQSVPSVAMAKDGGFVVVWSGPGQGDPNGGVFGRRYNASGIPQGSDFQVNVYTTGGQASPRVSIGSDGSFVVAWASAGQDGGTYGVFARAFTASGVPQGGEFQVNTFTTGNQAAPALAAQPGNRFLVTWASSGQDGDLFGVFGRRFAEDLIFQDGFESGDLSKWSSAATDSGDLHPSVLAALKFTSLGLEGVVDDTASLFVQDETPIDEDRYRARFYFDTNGFDPGEASGAHRTRIFIVFEEAPTRRLAAIVLKRQAGAYSLEGRARLDSGLQADTGFFAISPGVHSVELDWKRSSSAIANDGTFQLWIDGVSPSTLTGLANRQSAADFVRLGALSVKGSANGTLYWDEFESRRITFIGN